jgi:hypothetical protein
MTLHFICAKKKTNGTHLYKEYEKGSTKYYLLGAILIKGVAYK